MGASKLPRFYTMIETKGGWLDQLLVKKGMARVYGMRITTPDVKNSGDYRNILSKISDLSLE